MIELTNNAKKVLEKRYLRDGEKTEDLFRRVGVMAYKETETDKIHGIRQRGRDGELNLKT